MKRIISLIIFFTAFFTFSAAAQSAIDNTIGFGPRVGYYKAQDAGEGNFFFGLQTRLRFGAIVGVEGAIEYRAGQEFGFDDLDIGDLDIGDLDITAKTSFVPVTASLMLFAPLGGSISPYGLAGIGAYYTNYNFSDDAENLDLGETIDELTDDSSFSLGYHLGLGVEIPFNDNTALSVDYRYLFLNPDDNQESFDDATFNGNSFTASLMLYF